MNILISLYTFKISFKKLYSWMELMVTQRQLWFLIFVKVTVIDYIQKRASLHALYIIYYNFKSKYNTKKKKQSHNGCCYYTCTMFYTFDPDDIKFICCAYISSFALNNAPLINTPHNGTAHHGRLIFTSLTYITEIF